MSRTFFAALALIGLAACGGAKKPATHAAKPTSTTPHTRAPAAKPKTKARQTTTRRDTVAAIRNPLGH